MGFGRKKTVSQVEKNDASCLSPEFELQTWLVKATFFISLLIGLVLLLFDLPSGNGKRVTPRIFQGCPSVFEAFVICVIFAFTCSFSWLFIRNKPKFTTFRRFYFIISMVFMALALSILASALFSPGSRLWNWNPGNFRSQIVTTKDFTTPPPTDAKEIAPSRSRSFDSTSTTMNQLGSVSLSQRSVLTKLRQE